MTMHQVLETDHGRGPGLDRGVLGALDHPDHLDVAIRGLRVPVAVPASIASGVLGVEGISLAAQSTVSPVRAPDLVDEAPPGRSAATRPAP